MERPEWVRGELDAHRGCNYSSFRFAMNLNVELRLPYLWGEESFERNEWSPITYFVGPNGTGKTLLAEAVTQSAQTQQLRPRYLSAERLGGIEKASGGSFTSHQFDRGFCYRQTLVRT
jgi:SpoVK/Ycf46/Vps4 family AAA+-type ATPase